MNVRDRMKFYSARRVWLMRNELTPSSARDKPRTWERWFADKYGEPLQAYLNRARREGIQQQVIDHEIAEFGWSPLQ